MCRGRFRQYDATSLPLCTATYNKHQLLRSRPRDSGAKFRFFYNTVELAIVAGICINSSTNVEIRNEPGWTGARLTTDNVTLTSSIKSDVNYSFSQTSSRYCLEGTCVVYSRRCSGGDQKFVCALYYRYKRDKFSKSISVEGESRSAVDYVMSKVKLVSGVNTPLLPLSSLSVEESSQRRPMTVIAYEQVDLPDLGVIEIRYRNQSNAKMCLPLGQWPGPAGGILDAEDRVFLVVGSQHFPMKWFDPWPCIGGKGNRCETVVRKGHSLVARIPYGFFDLPSDLKQQPKHLEFTARAYPCEHD